MPLARCESYMTDEEKYEQIVKSRSGEGDTKGNLQSGVKADPQAEQKAGEASTETEAKVTGTEEKENSTEAKGTAKKTLTDEEKRNHAMAAQRIKEKGYTKKIAELEAEINALKNASQAPKRKTRDDFKTDEEYKQYVQSEFAGEIKSNVLNEIRKQQSEQQEAVNSRRELETEITKYYGDEVRNKIIAELSDPYSEMAQIVTDPRAKALVEAIRDSKEKPHILAAMQATPQAFAELLNESPRRQEFAIFQMENNIRSKLQGYVQKQLDQQKKQERADAVPAMGTFGTNTNGVTDISKLSTKERVERYKADMRKKGLI